MNMMGTGNALAQGFMNRQEQNRRQRELAAAEQARLAAEERARQDENRIYGRNRADLLTDRATLEAKTKEQEARDNEGFLNVYSSIKPDQANAIRSLGKPLPEKAWEAIFKSVDRQDAFNNQKALNEQNHGFQMQEIGQQATNAKSLETFRTDEDIRQANTIGDATYTREHKPIPTNVSEDGAKIISYAQQIIEEDGLSEFQKSIAQGGQISNLINTLPDDEINSVTKEVNKIEREAIFQDVEKKKIEKEERLRKRNRSFREKSQDSANDTVNYLNNRVNGGGTRPIQEWGK